MSKKLALRKNLTMPAIKVTPIVRNIVGWSAIGLGGINCFRVMNKTIRDDMKGAGINIPFYIFQNIVFIAAGFILLADKGRK